MVDDTDGFANYEAAKASDLLTTNLVSTLEFQQWPIFVTLDRAARGAFVDRPRLLTQWLWQTFPASPVVHRLHLLQSVSKTQHTSEIVSANPSVSRYIQEMFA